MQETKEESFRKDFNMN